MSDENQRRKRNDLSPKEINYHGKNVRADFLGSILANVKYFCHDFGVCVCVLVNAF